MQVTLTLSDFVRPWRLRAWRLYRWVAYPCLILGLLILMPRPPEPDGSPASHAGAIEFLAIAAALYAFTWVVPVLQFRSVPADKRTCNWSFYPDRIECSTAVSRGTMQWNAFVKIHETKPAFLLFSHASLFAIIPKRTLSADSVLKLRRMSIEALGAKHVKIDFAAHQANNAGSR